MEKTIERLMTINGCARCGENHQDIPFHILLRPMGEWTHWGSCPNTKEPILLRIVDTTMETTPTALTVEALNNEIQILSNMLSATRIEDVRRIRSIANKLTNLVATETHGLTDERNIFSSADLLIAFNAGAENHAKDLEGNAEYKDATQWYKKYIGEENIATDFNELAKLHPDCFLPAQPKRRTVEEEAENMFERGNWHKMHPDSEPMMHRSEILCLLEEALKNTEFLRDQQAPSEKKYKHDAVCPHCIQNDCSHIEREAPSTMANNVPQVKAIVEVMKDNKINDIVTYGEGGEYESRESAIGLVNALTSPVDATIYDATITIEKRI